MKKLKDISELDSKTLTAIAKMKAEMSDSLAMDRQKLLMNYPFIGDILMSMEIVPVRDIRVLTACTDGNRIYFGMDFYYKLKSAEAKFVLGHEVWHCVMMHMFRKQTRDINLFNIAADMEVNKLLKDDGFTPPPNLLFPDNSLEGLSAEEIYEKLLNKSKGNGSSSPTSGKNSSKSNASESKSKKSDGNKTGELSGQFDKHTYADDDADTATNGAGDLPSDRFGEIGTDPDYSPHVDADLSEQIRERIISSAERMRRTAGTLPSSVEGLLEKICSPEISWKELLKQFVTSCYGGERQWLPPARRHIYNDVYFQSRRNESLKIAVAVDTSGSCVEDLPKFFSELNSLIGSFGCYDLTLIQNDYKISQVEHFDQDNRFEPKEFKWKGSGGTSFKPPFDWIKKNNIDIDCFVFFTDGYEWSDSVSNDNTRPPYPVLWVLTNNGNRDFCPWGKKIYFKESSY